MSCQTNHENKKISDLIQVIKLNIDHDVRKHDIMFEWISYDQFNDIKEIGKGGFSTVYSAIWKDGLLSYGFKYIKSEWKRESNTKVALKCLNNSQNFLDEFINEVKAYLNQKMDNILKIYGISQSPTTKDYIMVLEYAEGGDFNSYLNKKYEVFDWFNGLSVLTNTIKGLNKIHQKQMVHRDFHIGNILFTKLTKFDQYHNVNNESIDYVACISDMGLCKKIDDINETSIYGVMPYVAPEVLKGKPYTQAADIYSFGMIMYVIATGRQPFADCAHDGVLALKICNGIRPGINNKIAPKCYIDLMKKCWDSNPDNRPNSIELKEFIDRFYNSLNQKFNKKEQIHHETEIQFNETQEYRKENFLSIKNNQLTTHTQAIYTSRLLNSFTKDLPKYEDNFNNTVEITDFTK
ncbi:kinase-like domain-containing protein [Rhizophagus diaphanus]|nr:kinase-like domain-containing protein [Rhizophagus diaphanus] [Rhizophagus sp. MUCL 43196]